MSASLLAPHCVSGNGGWSCLPLRVVGGGLGEPPTQMEPEQQAPHTDQVPRRRPQWDSPSWTRARFPQKVLTQLSGPGDRWPQRALLPPLARPPDPVCRACCPALAGWLPCRNGAAMSPLCGRSSRHSPPASWRCPGGRREGLSPAHPFLGPTPSTGTGHSTMPGCAPP